jgi:methyl-galactoside transport system permease protein
MRVKEKFNLRLFLMNNAIYAIMLVMILLVVSIKPSFFSLRVLRDILMQSSVRIVVALGCMFVILSGSADLSGGRMVGLAAVVAGSLAEQSTYYLHFYPNLPELPAFVPLLAALLLGLLFGLFNGFVVSKLKVPAFLATRGTPMLVLGLSNRYIDMSPTARSRSGSYRKAFRRWIGSVANIPIILIIALFCVLLVWVLQSKTVLGKEIFAVGGNMEAARVSGINVFKIQMFTFAIAGTLYGLGGCLEAARTGSATAAFGTGYELDAIAACIIGGCSAGGGIGGVGGVVAGVIIFNIMSYGLTFIGLSPYWQYVARA